MISSFDVGTPPLLFDPRGKREQFPPHRQARKGDNITAASRRQLTESYVQESQNSNSNAQTRCAFPSRYAL
jgi:hypothetical protein